MSSHYPEHSQIPDFTHVGVCLTDSGADVIEKFWSLKLSGHLLRCLFFLIAEGAVETASGYFSEDPYLIIFDSQHSLAAHDCL